MRFIFLGIGSPFAQEDLEIAPIERFELGKVPAPAGTSIGLGL